MEMQYLWLRFSKDLNFPCIYTMQFYIHHHYPPISSSTPSHFVPNLMSFFVINNPKSKLCHLYARGCAAIPAWDLCTPPSSGHFPKGEWLPPCKGFLLSLKCTVLSRLGSLHVCHSPPLPLLYYITCLSFVKETTAKESLFPSSPVLLQLQHLWPLRASTLMCTYSPPEIHAYN